MQRCSMLSLLILIQACGPGSVASEKETLPSVLTTRGVTASLTVYFGDIIITSATGIDLLRGYRLVKGNVFINPLGISDLRGLESLQTIEGTLDIAYDSSQRQSLKSLEGLDALEHVTGYVQLENCDLLEHLGGLDSLRRVGGSLSVYNNERLNSVDALGGLEHVELNFNILNNPQLPCHEAETLVSALGESNVGGDVSVLNNGEEVGASCL